MEKYSHNHWLFLHNFSVPFDDNILERDLRKAKNRQKIAGGFRKDSGHEMYCSIMTIIETIKKRKMEIIENIKNFLREHRLFFSRCKTRCFSRRLNYYAVSMYAVYSLILSSSVRFTPATVRKLLRYIFVF